MFMPPRCRVLKLDFGAKTGLVSYINQIKSLNNFLQNDHDLIGHSSVSLFVDSLPLLWGLQVLRALSSFPHQNHNFQHISIRLQN